MDRRLFASFGLGAALLIGGLVPGRVPKALAQKSRNRNALGMLWEAAESHYRSGRYDSALAVARRLDTYIENDPRWHTYPESFRLALIRFRLTPLKPDGERIQAARAVFESHESLTGHLLEGVTSVAQASYELLLAGELGKTPSTSSEQSTFALYALQFSAAAQGSERVIWAQAALSHFRRNNVNLIEDWGRVGMGLRLTAVGTGLGGDWQGATRSFERMLAMKQASDSFDPSRIGPAGGFGALHEGRESLEAETATALALTGRIEAAISMLERSRRNTPFLKRNRGTEGRQSRELEHTLVASGVTVIQISVTLSGAAAITSFLQDGRISRLFTYDVEPGGLVAQSLIVNTGTVEDKQDGLLNDYQKARAGIDRDARASFGEYIEKAVSVTERLVGSAFEDALRKSGANADTEVLVIVPPSLSFLPISLLGLGKKAKVLGESVNLRYCDSLTSAANTRPMAIASTKPAKTVGVLALSEARGGPQFAETEAAGIQAIAAQVGLSANSIPLRRGRLQWPTDSEIWHLITHASWNFEDSNKSGLALGRRRIATIDDILSLRPAHPPRLVFLSACETGLPNTGQPLDQFLSLPTAFIASGAGGVIASHWPVSDAASTVLSLKFYQLLFEQSLPAHVALGSAQSWLSKSPVERILQFLSEIAAEDKYFKQASADILSYLLSFSTGVNVFEDPYYWGGFQYYGS